MIAMLAWRYGQFANSILFAIIATLATLSILIDYKFCREIVILSIATICINILYMLNIYRMIVRMNRDFLAIYDARRTM